MEPQPTFQCLLEILPDGKAIPYGSGTRCDGTINHGFRLLKGRPADIGSIPEVEHDPALADLLAKLNSGDTAFFTVGCVSASVQSSEGHRMSGYVEIALNSRSLVADAVNYFVLFFDFSGRMQQIKFTEPALLRWQLIGATFLDATCDGFTCRIIINTSVFKSEPAAYDCWEKTLAVIRENLTWKQDFPIDVIY